MSDAELAALTAIVVAETASMKCENDFRIQAGMSQAYPDSCITGTDAMKSLDAELRRRGVIK